MDQNPKQQVIERVKSSTNILVTVSNNPSVDQLAACIGFTLMLNKLGKHATAVFSGAIPSTIEFLQPELTIEKTTDSLQDFIIALDKSKADKLRYKVEDDVVRIFITPYRTSIGEKDLEFSLGDFNVDAVIALGITNKEEIDQAIVAHGRILHDAVVMTITDGEVESTVGSINWHDPVASSLSEMLVSISESFQSGLLDPQMATSFLTGIVSETERFSNDKTSPKVMTMSAQLMAAGANQQLIATKLTPPEPEPTPVEEAEPVAPYVPEEKPNSDGEIEIEHEEEEEAPKEEPEVELPAEPPVDQDEIHIDDQGNLKLQAEILEAEKARLAAEEKARRDAESTPIDNVPMTGSGEDSSAEGSFLSGGQRKVLNPLPGQENYDPLLPSAPAGDALTLPPVEETAEINEPAPEAPAQQPEAPQFPEPPTPPAPVLGMPQPEETLSQLEQEVGSPHANMVDDARQAVATAGIDIPPPPKAAESLGAQHVDLDSLAAASAPQEPVPTPPVAPEASTMTGIADILKSTSSVDGAAIETPAPAVQETSAPTDPMAPPPVPPPMTAPYFEPKTSHHNPYLNPENKPTSNDENDAPL